MPGLIHWEDHLKPVDYARTMGGLQKWRVMPSETPPLTDPVFLALAAIVIAVVGAVLAVRGSTRPALTCVLMALIFVVVSLLWSRRRRT